MGRLLYGGGAALLSLINPVVEVLIGLAVLVFVDFVSGVMASRQRAKDKGEDWMFSSDKCWKTLYKLEIIVVVVMGFWFVDHRILTMHENLYLMRYAAAFICGAELYSLIENGYDITKADVFKALLIFTQKKINKAVGEDVPLNRKE